MRSLHADLTAAQKTSSREPHVALSFFNDVGVVRRHDFKQLDAAVNPNAKHDVAVTADGAVQRVRVDDGAVKHQRVANPTVGPWNAWTTLAAGMGSQIACAAFGARVIVIYNSGLNIRFRESTDSGVTFSADALLFASAFTISDLAVAYKNTAGDLAVAWSTSGTPNVYINVRTAGAFAGASAMPTAVQSVNGVALVRGLIWDLVITGEELTTKKPTVWNINHNETGAVWSTLWPQVQGEELITAFGSPSLTFTDTWRVVFIEQQLFSGGATRLYRASVHPNAGFAAGSFTWRTPAPDAYSNAFGIAHAFDQTFAQDFIYESSVDVVRRADTTITELDATADVLQLDIEETTRAMRGYVELDNSAGAYTLPPPPIALGARVAIAVGYDTASGIRTSALADFWISGWEHHRGAEGSRQGRGRATLRVLLEGGWELLRRSTQRTTINHTTDNYTAILNRICARAGLDFANTAPSARMGSVTPAFTIDPNTDGLTALRQAYAFLADRAVMKADGAVRSTEPLAAETSDYTFGADHPLNAVVLRTVPSPVSEAHAFGAAVFGDDLDFAQLDLGVGAIARLRDLTSSTSAAADATALAHRRQRALDADHGTLIAPPCCGLELLDVIDFTDGLVSSDPVLRRVTGIRWRYDRRTAIYQQHISLGPR